MNVKTPLFAALLISCMGLTAASPVEFNPKPLVNPGIGNSNILQRNTSPRVVLKTSKSAFIGSGKEWDENEVSGSGLFIHLGIFFPPSAYMNPHGSDIHYGTGIDFEFGSFFRLLKMQSGGMGIGLRATWLSVSYSSVKVGSDVWRVAQISPLRVGPQMSFALSETIGLDVFYQLGFNLTEEFGSIDDPTNTKDIGYSITYTGISHEIGAALHYKAFCFGFGYRMGMMKNVGLVIDGKKYDKDSFDDKKSSINNFHITLGFRF